jgi:hypothetical protein
VCNFIRNRGPGLFVSSFILFFLTSSLFSGSGKFVVVAAHLQAEAQTEHTFWKLLFRLVLSCGVLYG